MTCIAGVREEGKGGGRQEAIDDLLVGGWCVFCGQVLLTERRWLY